MPRRKKKLGYVGTSFPNVRRRNDVLYYRYRMAGGMWREMRYGAGEARDAARAQQHAQEQADAERAGLIDPRAARMLEYGNQPIALVIEDFVAHLRDSKRDTPDHIAAVKAFIERCVEACGVDTLLDFHPQAANRWLADHDWATATRNAARYAVTSMTRWAHDFGKIAYNPLPPALIPKGDPNADRRRLSRAMTTDEFWQLIGWLRNPPAMDRPSRFAKQAPIRAAFYLIAANTGLRWREIARLTWGMVDLDAGAIDVPAGQTKNRKRAELPLAGVVIDALQRIMPDDAKPGVKIFSAEPRLKTWKDDLVRAGIIDRDKEGNLIGYQDDRGRQLDRKCLRMTFATWLKDSGVDLRDAQRLMRHSDPALTANIYTDVRLTNLRGAVDRLPGQPAERSPAGKKAAQ